MSSDFSSVVPQGETQNGRKHQTPVQSERFYIVQSGPASTEHLCVLENGSAVLCTMTERADARIAALSHENLEVVPHSQLSEDERRRIDEALR